MRKLSIVIPATGRLKSLENTLISVLENRPADCEVMVVFNTPYDDPYDLAGEVRFVDAPRHAGLIDCINLGILHADAPLVHLLACGVEASKGWTDAVLAHFDDPQVASVAPLVMDAHDHRRLICAGVGYSRSGVRRACGQGKTAEQISRLPNTAIGPCLSAGFYRKSIVRQEGLRPDATVGEQFVDVDWGLRLHEAGYKFAIEPTSRTFVATERRSIHRGSFRQGLHAERLFLKHCGSKGWVGSLTTHLLMVCGEFVAGAPRLSALANWQAGWLLGVIRDAIDDACPTRSLRPARLTAVEFIRQNLGRFLRRLPRKRMLCVVPPRGDNRVA